ncbi:hypothetical protein, partial [Ruminococcus callidus]|uniref:hypothetical protein n=1 Tax=Ruminococcus callidus TaxID=40519 RepID=UPI0023F9C6CE
PQTPLRKLHFIFSHRGYSPYEKKWNKSLGKGVWGETFLRKFLPSKIAPMTAVIWLYQFC